METETLINFSIAIITHTLIYYKLIIPNIDKKSENGCISMLQFNPTIVILIFKTNKQFINW